MTQTRSPKKSESLEIRIPYPTKQAFMTRCQDEGRSASEALRGFIEQHLRATDTVEPDAPPLGSVSRNAPRQARHRGLLRLAAGALVAAAVGTMAVPSLARTSDQTDFTRLDANADGRLTIAELSRGVRVDAGLQVDGPGLAAPRKTIALTGTEGARARELLVRLMVLRLDADGDGTVSMAEYRGVERTAPSPGR